MSVDKQVLDRFFTIMTTVGFAVTAYLASSFFDGFVTQAEYNESLGALRVIDTRLQRIEKDIEEIKSFTKKPH